MEGHCDLLFVVLKCILRNWDYHAAGWMGGRDVRISIGAIQPETQRQMWWYVSRLLLWLKLGEINLKLSGVSSVLFLCLVGLGSVMNGYGRVLIFTG